MLYDDIRSDLVDSMKAKESTSVTCLRTLIAGIQSDVKDNKIALTDDVVIKHIKKGIKDRDTTLSFISDGKHEDLRESLKKEKAILNKYLPKTASLEDTERYAVTSIQEVGAEGLKDTGKVLGYMREKYGSGVDMSLASSIVRAILGKRE